MEAERAEKEAKKAERRRKKEEAAEAERQRREAEEEAEHKRQEDEERQRREAEAEKQREEAEARARSEEVRRRRKAAEEKVWAISDDVRREAEAMGRPQGQVLATWQGPPRRKPRVKGSVTPSEGSGPSSTAWRKRKRVSDGSTPPAKRGPLRAK